MIASWILVGDHSVNDNECGFPLAEESKEAENVFLTHGWESGYGCAGGFRSRVFLGFSFCFAIHHCLTCPTHPPVK